MAVIGITLRQLAEVPKSCCVSDTDLDLLVRAQHPDPGSLLGPHVISGYAVLRCWVSGAQAIHVKSDVFLGEISDEKVDPPSQVSLQQVAAHLSDCPWLFEAAFEFEGEKLDTAALRSKWNYEMCVEYGDGHSSTLTDPYSLGPLLPESFLRGWASGTPEEPPASMFGARHMELRSERSGLWGTRFAVWAPHAKAVSVVGDWNFWDRRAHPLCRRQSFGTWELFLPVWDLRGQKFGYAILDSEGKHVVKTDPFALEFVDPSEGGHDAKVPEQDEYSRAAWNGNFSWSDGAWLEHRAKSFGSDSWSSQPLSIYEVHLASWSHTEAGEPRGYRAIAEPLAKHVKELGFTCVEFLPVSQYPSEQSWGYQCAAGLYAVDRRLGTPDDFRYLVDTLHQHSIAVFVDFVVAHFAKDEWGLVRYGGAPQFEYEGELGELPGWGTARFDYSKPEVRSYLLGAAHFWIEHFHIDGLRLDAVAAMVYRSFGREEDGDAILAGKGVINEDGVALLRELCSQVRSRHPGVLLSAEESTNFKWVTSRAAVHGTERQQVQVQDLGFHLKWNMGFSFDTLQFFGTEAAKRPHLETFGCKRLAWYLVYAFNERWILPFSHDNAAHRSLLDQMTAPGEGDSKVRFALLRLMLLYTVGMPGRPLLFMGSEVGEEAWSHNRPIDWTKVAADPSKKQLKSWVAKLLHLYRDLPALHRQDDEAAGFAWIDKDSSSRCIYAWQRSTPGEADTIVVVNASASHVQQYQVRMNPSASGPWRCLAATSLEDEPGAEQAPPTVDVLPGCDHFVVDLPPCAAQLWSAPDPAAASVPAGLARLQFQVRHAESKPGECSVHVVGNCAELGNWDPKSGLVLKSNETAFPIWHAHIDLPPTSDTVLFKFVIVQNGRGYDAAGEVSWENLPHNANREVRFTADSVVRINAEFGRL
eukprot:TRINITY_DN106204_c0_g1_i1.p1 TRINITY_DN106204_c0_g1~~TRINITY_DN106204_c0_g1_i1.p1  ORF type:complete len:942 (+),score=183.64 TRINITY_DN106204_c0_g1_i1:59-2827(+)